MASGGHSCAIPFGHPSKIASESNMAMVKHYFKPCKTTLIVLVVSFEGWEAKEKARPLVAMPCGFPHNLIFQFSKHPSRPNKQLVSNIAIAMLIVLTVTFNDEKEGKNTCPPAGIPWDPP